MEKQGASWDSLGVDEIDGKEIRYWPSYHGVGMLWLEYADVLAEKDSDLVALAFVGDSGWFNARKFPAPCLITRQQVAALIPLLQHFVDTGELPK